MSTTNASTSTSTSTNTATAPRSSKPASASASSPYSWRQAMPVPRLLQQLFDLVPLATYSANTLPARSPSTTPDQLPTLYVFASDEDARFGAPSFNPSCLKWQTYLKLAGVRFHITPSTNHASPSGALPFLLPARSSPTDSPAPIPSNKLQHYAFAQGPAPPPELTSLRLEAYQALLDLPVRNAWLQSLYLEPAHAALLDELYVAPASSSGWIRASLRAQLRRAAEAEILRTSSSATAAVVDVDAVYAAALEAFEALAGLLAESETGWFFGAAQPTLFDASVFAYTHLMLRYLGPGEENGSAQAAEAPFVPARLGVVVGCAGAGELERHRERMLKRVWGEPLVDADGVRRSIE
ncbi:hypothetical protein B0T22DRAFT_537775 [Podospora appendiculata]|uniref:Mitochondrial outer membrane protein n=1 Tax=Podospora appendiculata TaxID=314037 RepID=A0AAE0X5N9_9PEZI|nr:hypothetical protein B0T22DRAFT_537775 [Podospora appendiculata]